MEKRGGEDMGRAGREGGYKKHLCLCRKGVIERQSYLQKNQSMRRHDVYSQE